MLNKKEIKNQMEELIENDLIKSFVIDESKLKYTLEYDESGKFIKVPIEIGTGKKVKYIKTKIGWIKLYQ